VGVSINMPGLASREALYQVSSDFTYFTFLSFAIARSAAQRAAQRSGDGNDVSSYVEREV